MLLVKDKVNITKLLISKSFIKLREYNEMKEKIKKSWNSCGIYYIKTMKANCVSWKKYTANKNSSVRKTKQNRLML